MGRVALVGVDSTMGTVCTTASFLHNKHNYWGVRSGQNAGYLQEPVERRCF